MKACVQSKCGPELSACEGDSACATTINCAMACNDDVCKSKCAKMPANNSAATALGLCMIQNQCVPTTQPSDTCGDGTCGTTESKSSCPQDCGPAGPVCGNGTCEDGETPASCSIDCQTAPLCGNGTCETGETVASCAIDCKAGPVCGNGTCETGESKSTCPTDCGTTTTGTCGDLQCTSGESETCPIDCTSNYAPTVQCAISKCGSQWAACMGDSKCQTFFNCASSCNCDSACIQTCGANIASNSAAIAIVTCASNQKCADPCATTNKCGNGVCDSGETNATCAVDCPGAPMCGNGTCETGETATNCAADCATTTGHYCDSHCGSSGSGCYCDPSCKKYGDCCTAAGGPPATKTYTCVGSTCTDCNTP